MQAAYDYCPTGNEADLASTILTAVALGNPLRQGSEVYDDLTKDYFLMSGMITEDYSRTPTQLPGMLAGDVVGGAFAPAGAELAGGGAAVAACVVDPACDAAVAIAGAVAAGVVTYQNRGAIESAVSNVLQFAGKEFRGGRQGQRDRNYGVSNKAF